MSLAEYDADGSFPGCFPGSFIATGRDLSDREFFGAFRRQKCWSEA